MFHNESDSATLCKRCGTCCKKGGPALHIEDKALVENGLIPAKNLFTIRNGEPAYDNIKRELVTSVTDIIKIKSQRGSSTCVFYQGEDSCCSIYQHRPLECRILSCRDTDKISEAYDQNRLIRADIIGDINGLRELIEDHQRRCPFEPVLAFVKKMEISLKIDPQLEKKVRYIINYDLEIRSLIEKQASIDVEMMDFLFGRPVLETLKALGMNIRHEKGKIIIKSIL